MCRHRVLYVAVGIEVSRAMPGKAKLSASALTRIAGELAAVAGIANQVDEDVGELRVSLRRHEHCHVIPLLAQARDVTQHERTSRKRGLEHRKPERLVARGLRVDRRARH